MKTRVPALTHAQSRALHCASEHGGLVSSAPAPGCGEPGECKCDCPDGTCCWIHPSTLAALLRRGALVPLAVDPAGIIRRARVATNQTQDAE